VAPGHQLGFNDLKAIEIADFINAIADVQAEPFNFERGYRIQTLVEKINKSSTEGKWLKV
jgi:predicted dehydrogenase